MSFIRWLKGLFSGAPRKDDLRISPAAQRIVKETLQESEGIDKARIDTVFADIARVMPEKMRDLHFLSNELQEVGGMSARDAAAASRLLANRLTAVTARERQIDLGIKTAIWMYSGAACMHSAPSSASDHEKRQDAEHHAANKKKYSIQEGMFLNGKWTWPGMEKGCKCVSRPVLPGYE